MHGGGVRGDQHKTQQIPANMPAGKGTVPAKSASAADEVTRGFTNKNTVSRGGGGKTHSALNQKRQVRLPVPRFDAADATPAMQAKIAQTMDSTALMYTYNEILSELSDALDSDIDEDEAEGETGLFAGSKKGRGALSLAVTRGARQHSGQGMGKHGRSYDSMSMNVSGKGGELSAKQDVQEHAMDLFNKIAAIEDAPPELMREIKVLSGKAANMVLTGNIEDAARMLMEIQTKLQDTRIKFDQETIQAGKLKRQQIHSSRIGKLHEAIEKMEEAKKSGIIGKIFAGIATVLACVVAGITIATGVGAKAGVMLIVACTIMIALTVSQNTGNWMSNLGGLIQDDTMELIMGIAWALLAAALSLGAGLAGSAAKAPADAVTTATQQTANATGQAAQQSANAAAQAASTTATETTKAATTAAEVSAKTTAKVAEETAKQTAKASAKVVGESAKQTGKAAVKVAKETAEETAEQTTKSTTQEVSKTVAESAKETVKNSADDLAQKAADQAISKKIHYYQRAAHIGRFMQGASMGTEASAELNATKLRYEGEMYQASATDDLALMTRIQQQMEDWMEAIQRTLQEIQEGQQTASDMLSQTQQNKFTIARNI